MYEHLYTIHVHFKLLLPSAPFTVSLDSDGPARFTLPQAGVGAAALLFPMEVTEKAELVN